MQAVGMQIWYPAERLAVMGLVEVLRHLPRLLALRRDVYARTLQDRPAVFIGIDAPDFNLGLERKLRRAGMRTAHYVSPSVWAWREKRAEKIGRSAELVLLFRWTPDLRATAWQLNSSATRSRDLAAAQAEWPRGSAASKR